MQVPLCNDNKVWKYANQIPNPSSHSPSSFHDSGTMEEVLEWFMKSTVKTNFSISQDDITAHNLSLEYDLDTCHPIPYISDGPLPLNLPNQCLPNLSNEHVQGSHILKVEEQECEAYFDIYSLFQSPLCEYGVSSLLASNESKNLGDESNRINFPDQFEVLGNQHPDHSDSIIVWDDVFPSAPTDILVPPDDFYLIELDLDSDPAEENVLIKTSSSSHCSLWSPFCDASTCHEDTPCSLGYSFNVLTSQLAQGGEDIHDERENNQITKYPFNPSSSLVLHKDNYSNQLARETSLIHSSLDL